MQPDRASMAATTDEAARHDDEESEPHNQRHQPVADNQNSLSAGSRGLLLQGVHLVEKLTHQNRERIPERVVHAKGWGAHGTLTVTGEISQFTKAKALQPGATTDLILRFSTVAGEMGAADAEREVRGFSIKFYTPEGNWDLVGNNTPVSFVRDPLKFPDFIHTQKCHPRSNLRSPTAMWDFRSLSPESLHQVTILMSDRGLPTDVRHLNGYGSHTYSLINAANERIARRNHAAHDGLRPRLFIPDKLSQSRFNAAFLPPFAGRQRCIPRSARGVLPMRNSGSVPGRPC